MIKKLSKDIIFLLKLLSRSESGLDVSTITWRFKLPIARVVSAFREAELSGLVNREDSRLRMTPAGRRWVIEHRHLFVLDGEKPWRTVPSRFRGQQISISEPYVPRRSLLQKKLRGMDNSQE